MSWRRTVLDGPKGPETWFSSYAKYQRAQGFADATAIIRGENNEYSGYQSKSAERRNPCLLTKTHQGIVLL